MVTLFDSLQQWLPTARDVRVAVVFGSYARALCGEGQPADPWSDIDLEIVTTRPEIYRDRAWTQRLVGQELQAYAVRPVFGGAQKVTALFSGGEADFIVIRHRRLLLGRMAFAVGLHKHVPSIRRGLGEFALVMSFGQKVLKGGAGWQRFYTRAVAEVPLAHLTDEEGTALAECAYVDAVSIMSKLGRGEYVAAQRWLHRSVIETNFRLMHELRARKKIVSYPDGRRVEQILSPAELAGVRFEVSLTRESLQAATVAALAATRRLLTELTGRTPSWPELR